MEKPKAPADMKAMSRWKEREERGKSADLFGSREEGTRTGSQGKHFGGTPGALESFWCRNLVSGCPLAPSPIVLATVVNTASSRCESWLLLLLDYNLIKAYYSIKKWMDIGLLLHGLILFIFRNLNVNVTLPISS